MYLRNLSGNVKLAVRDLKLGLKGAIETKDINLIDTSLQMHS